MKKQKILYVHGFNELPNSELFNKLKDEIDNNKYELISDYYAQYNPEEAVYDLNHIIQNNHIDILIGHDLGGYLITLLYNDLIKILIDPVYNPVNALTKLDAPKHIIEFYKNSELKPVNFDKTYCVFISGNDYKEYANVCKNTTKQEDINSINKILNEI